MCSLPIAFIVSAEHCFVFFPEPCTGLISTKLGTNTAGITIALHISFLYPLANKVLGGILVSPSLSVCLAVCQSVCPSVCPPSVDMILSTHVLRNGCMDFSENLYTDYSTLQDVHLVFSY